MKQKYYLLGKQVLQSNVAVALADNGGMLPASQSIHEPMGVVIVKDMEEAPPSTPWHPLYRVLRV